MGGKDETTVNVVVALSDGFVSISRSANELRIAGTVDRLAILADNIRHVANSTPPAHAHIEYHPGHPYLDPACASLIVANEDQPGNRVLRSGRWRYGGTVQEYVWIICQNYDFYHEEFYREPPDMSAEGESFYVLYGLEPDVTRHSSRSRTCLSLHEAVVVAEQTLQQLTWDPPP